MSDDTTGTAADAVKTTPDGETGAVDTAQLAKDLAAAKEKALNFEAMYTESFNEKDKMAAALKKANAEAKAYRLKSKGTDGTESDDIKAAVESVRQEYEGKLTTTDARNKTLLNNIRKSSIQNVIATEAAKLGVMSAKIPIIQKMLGDRITLNEETLEPMVLREDGNGSAFKGGGHMTIPEMVKQYCESPDNTFLYPSNPNSGSGGSPGRTGTGGKVWTREEIKALSRNPVEYAKHQVEIRKQAALGLIK